MVTLKNYDHLQILEVSLGRLKMMVANVNLSNTGNKRKTEIDEICQDVNQLKVNFVEAKFLTVRPNQIVIIPIKRFES